MKASIILVSLALSGLALPLSAAESLTGKLTGKLTEKLLESDVGGDIAKQALSSYAASQLGLPEGKISGGLGSLFKVAQDNLTKENFSSLSGAIPGMKNYIDLAPAVSKSAIGSLLGNSKTAKKAQSIQYLDSAFEQLGIPKESLPLLLNSVSGYLQSNGYGDVAGMLEKGLSFL